MAESVALKGMSKEKKLQYILDTTYGCLSEVGSNNITLELIAERASISKGTLCYYFQNKEELIAQSMKFQAKRYVNAAVMSKKDCDDPKQQLLNIIDTLWKFYVHEPKIMSVYYDLWSHGFYKKKYRMLAAEIYMEFRGIFEEPVRRILAKNDEHREECVLINASLVAGLIKGVSQQFLLSPETFDSSRTLEGLKSSVLKICGNVTCPC